MNHAPEVSSAASSAVRTAIAFRYGVSVAEVGWKRRIAAGLGLLPGGLTFPCWASRVSARRSNCELCTSVNGIWGQLFLGLGATLFRNARVAPNVASRLPALSRNAAETA